MTEEPELEDLPGVGPATAEKLEEANLDVTAIAVSNPSQLQTEADLGEGTAQDVVRAAREMADVGGFETATDVMESRSDMDKITTGVPAVDDIFDGGIETQAITEFYGEFGSGKSQVTTQLAVNVQLPTEHGGAEGSCIFIDTEDSFRAKRIAQMVRGLEEDVMETVLENSDHDFSVKDVKNSEIRTTDNPESPAEILAVDFLDNIHVAQAYNTKHQMLMAEKARSQAKDLRDDPDSPDPKLVVVDSLTAHFRSEYVGRGELAERQQKLNKHIHDLKRLVNTHNAAAVITNQVAANPDSYFGDPTNPIGGNILGHASTFRAYIQKRSEPERVIKLVDAPNLAVAEAKLKVMEDGLKPE